MPIVFNNIPTSIRTPAVYAEIDNSRALTGLVQNPHKVLILGQKASLAGTLPLTTLVAISRDNLADGYFGAGSILARMCNKFKSNNPNTEVYAMALGSGIAGTAASGAIDFSGALYSDVVSGTHIYYLMVNGEEIQVPITSGYSGGALASKAMSMINSTSTLPVIAALAAASRGKVVFSAICSGTLGNYINIRENYYNYQSTPSCFSTMYVLASYGVSLLTGGTVDPDLGDAWAVIDNEQFHYIVQPYIDSANLTEIEDELADRFLPLVDLQGHGFTAVRATQASMTTLGNSRNSPQNTIVGVDDGPQCPEEWASAWGAVSAWNLNNDPARPLHFLKLKGILPPPIDRRLSRAERDVILYDGIATWVVDTGGNVLIERCITTYQSNALGLPDPSYLDVQTLATLGEIRYQYKTRMVNRFIIPRFKLADDTFPVQPGTYIATPKTVKQETIALFTLLRDKGLIENLDDFVENLIVERDITDRNRVNVLLPADLINQFRILAANLQFIL
jgi:phage tail sheath gpL-like